MERQRPLARTPRLRRIAAMLTPRPDLSPLPAPPPEAAAKRTWKSALLFAGGIAAGAAVGYGLASGEALDALDALPGWALGAVLLVGIFFVIAVHEAGHLAGGAAAGFRFALFVVGPLRLERDRGRIKASLNRNIGLFGGLALSVPRDGHDLRRRVAWLVAGGPLASVALAAAAGAAAWALGGAWGAALGLIAFLSGAIALATLIPTRAGGFASDGARLLTLARGGPEAEREAAIFAVLAQAMNGARPRDWDAAVLERACALRDGEPMEEAALNFLALHALDLDDAERAREALARRVEIRDGVATPARASLALDAATFEGAVRRDAPRAEAWLGTLAEREPFADPTARAVARWAAAEASGDAQAAAAALADAHEHADLTEGMTRARLAWAGALPPEASAPNTAAPETPAPEARGDAEKTP